MTTERAYVRAVLHLAQAFVQVLNAASLIVVTDDEDPDLGALFEVSALEACRANEDFTGDAPTFVMFASAIDHLVLAAAAAEKLEGRVSVFRWASEWVRSIQERFASLAGVPPETLPTGLFRDVVDVVTGRVQLDPSRLKTGLFREVVDVATGRIKIDPNQVRRARGRRKRRR
jgi:hypothetical protein